MTDTTRDLIQAIAAGDATNTQNAFNLTMADKISTQLETLRADVAKNMFNTPESEPISERARDGDDSTHKFTGSVTNPEGHTKEWHLHYNDDHENVGDFDHHELKHRLHRDSPDELSHHEVRAIVNHFHNTDADDLESEHKGHHVKFDDEVSRIKHDY
jgi:hypothetical protein